MDFRDILARAPLCYFVDVLGVQKLSEWCAMVSDCYDFFGTQDQLWSTEGATAVLDVLHNSVEALKLFPDESADAWVVGNVLLSAIQ